VCSSDLQDKLKKTEEALVQAAFREKNKSVVSLMSPLTPAKESKIKVPPPMNPTTLSENEWRELVRCKEDVARLYAKVPLTNEESTLFMNALKRRNDLVAKAISEPVAENEREQFRLTLPVNAINTVIAEKAIGIEQFIERSAGYKSPSKIENLLVNKSAVYTAGNTTKYMENEVKESLKKKYGDGVIDDFENMKDVGTLVVRYKQDGGPAAAADTADLAIKKILNPTWSGRAQFAKSAGKFYSNQTQKALDLYMDQIDNFGEKLGAWGKIDRPNKEEDMNDAQKGVKKWLFSGFSDKKE
jgi:hypothetical protein